MQLKIAKISQYLYTLAPKVVKHTALYALLYTATVAVQKLLHLHVHCTSDTSQLSDD